MFALGGYVDGELMGIAHYLFHRSTWAPHRYCYLEDLFVAPTARGKGLGRALIEAVYEKAQAANASRVYWLTQSSNTQARILYDKVADNLGFIQYRKVHLNRGPPNQETKTGSEHVGYFRGEGAGVRRVRHRGRLAHQPDRGFHQMGRERGIKADWTALVDGWRAVYAASMDEVRKHPERGYVILDKLHRQSLEKLVAQLSITGLTDADLHHLTMGWHRLHAWPDSVAGLTRLKTKYIISPLSNGNVALLTNMAKFAGLPWDLVLSAELFEHYKPDPETYLGAAKLLCLPPEQVMMVAAHNHDLKAAQKLGLKTAFVARPTEYGPLQKYDFEAKGDWDIVAKDFGGIADRMGC